MTATGVWAVVVAAGRGDRFGGPKQYEDLGGRSVLDWSVTAATAACEGVVLVVTPELLVATRDSHGRPPVTVVAGGTTRSASVRAGLEAVPDDAAIIVVHDAARPLAPPALFDRVIDAVREGADGAVPGLAVTETIKRMHRARVVETLDRSELVAVQTPQAFRAGILRESHRSGDQATDDAALVEQAGGTVMVVQGDPRNIKITRREDLDQLRRVVP